MKTYSPLIRALPLLAALIPGVASAQASFTQAVGLFNVFVGLMLTAALLSYGIGFVVWLCRLGTWPSYRTEAIKVMEWSVVILFVLVVLLAIVQFFQYHPREAGVVVSAIVAILILWVVVYMVMQSGGGEKKEKH